MVFLVGLRCLLFVVSLCFVPTVALAAPPEEGVAEPGELAALQFTRSFNPVLVQQLVAGGTSAAERRELQERWLDGQAAAMADARLALEPDLIENLEVVRAVAAREYEQRSSQGMRLAAAAVNGALVRAAEALAERAPEAAASALRGCVVLTVAAEHQLECAQAWARLDQGAVIETLDELLRARPVDAQRAVETLSGLLTSSVLDAAQRSRVLALLEQQTKGMRKAALGERAVDAIARSGDPRAAEILTGLSKGIKNLVIRDDALRARALYLQDEEAVEVLARTALGKKLSAATDEDRLSAGRTLIELGHPTGWEWAAQELSVVGKSKGGFARGSQSSVDLRADVVEVLVRSGDPRAIPLLGDARLRRDDPLEVLIAVALLELGDASRIATVHEYLSHYDWAFLVPRMAVALFRFGDASGVEALPKAYERATKQTGKRIGSAVLSAVAGSLDQHLDERSTVRARAWLLKHEIVWALAQLGGEDSTQLLRQITADEDREVAASAALALVQLEAGDGQAALEAAFNRDYGADLFGRTVVSLLAAEVARGKGAEAARRLLEAAPLRSDPSLRALAEVL